MSTATSSNLSSRPTTPLRRRSQPKMHDVEVLNTVDGVLTEPLVELNDGLAMLDQNLRHVQMMHENITSFNESFSAFLYGLEMNAWCVEFLEAPNYGSFRRERGPVSELVQQQQKQQLQQQQHQQPQNQQQQQQLQPQQQEQEQQEQQHEDAPNQAEVDKVKGHLAQVVSEDSSLPSESTRSLIAVPKSRLIQPGNSTRIPTYSGSKISTNSISAKSKSSTALPKPTAAPWR